jgi:Tfp pilus assembly protein PilO
MRRNFEALRGSLPNAASARDPKFVLRVVLGVLVAANLIALWLVMSPPGGSVEELDARLTTLRANLTQRQAALGRSKEMAKRLDTARVQDENFQSKFFTDRRVASSTFVGELAKAAREAGIKPKEHVFAFEPVEGSDTLNMMTINANYEGTYADLLQFIYALDRSERFLILDSLGATPQQGTGVLNVQVKLNAFVRENVPPSDGVAK